VCRKDIHDRTYLSIGVTSGIGAGLCRVPGDGCFQGYRGEAMQDLGYGLPRISIPGTWVNKPHGPTAEGRREIAILMSFPPPLRLGFIVADRKPVAPACAIGSYATA
jgi:hypothetical protein